MTSLSNTLRPDVLAAAQGDAAAFGRLVDATCNLVSSIAVAKLGALEGSDDIAQEIYLAAWQNIHKLRQPESFLPWLKQLSRNRIHTAIRKRERERERAKLVDDSMRAITADATPSAAELLQEQENRRIVRDCLEQLPDDAREILALYYREGKTIRQVADLLEIRLDTAKKRLQRARTTLRVSTLAAFEIAIRKTAPTAAFTATVLASLGPNGGLAAASKIGTASTTTTAAAGSKLGAMLIAAGVGVALGLLGVVLFFHGYRRQSLNPDQQAELGRLARWSMGNVLFLTVGLVAVGLTHNKALLLSIWSIATIVHSWVYFIQVPRLPWVRVSPWARAARITIPGFGLIAGTATVIYAAMHL